VSVSDPVTILLMADYRADPLWRRYESRESKRVMSLDLNSLPLSPELKQQLRAWAARFDALAETGYEWLSADHERQWVTDGRALLEPVRQELGPGYDVIYFADQIPQCLSRPYGNPRCLRAHSSIRGMAVDQIGNWLPL
jgi:hypothetical protein